MKTICLNDTWKVSDKYQWYVIGLPSDYEVVIHIKCHGKLAILDGGSTILLVDRLSLTDVTYLESRVNGQK